jgi:hypothetical protein
VSGNRATEYCERSNAVAIIANGILHFALHRISMHDSISITLSQHCYWAVAAAVCSDFHFWLGAYF